MRTHSWFLLTSLAVLGAACSSSAAAPDGGIEAGADQALDVHRRDATTTDGTVDLADAEGADGPADATADAGAWHVPTCTLITGSAGITYTSDEGQTLAPTAGKLSGVAYTFGLVTLQRPNALVAQHGDELLASDDAGCSWSVLGKSPGLLHLVASGDTVYGWADNQATLIRIEGKTITTLKGPVANIHGLAVDPLMPRRLRIGGPGGQLHESQDRGQLWTKVGVQARAPGLDYRVAFDAQNLDHVLYGCATEGVYMTENGGTTWTRAQGLSTGTPPKANIFELAVSPTDGQIAWGMGIDLTLTPTKRQIYRSEDGGLTFAPVVAETAIIPLNNGTALWPHPHLRQLLYFAFGSKFSGGRLMKYDQTTGQVTSTTNGFHGIDALAVSPADDSLLYLGLSWKDFI